LSPLRYVFEQLAIQDTRKMESPETVKPRALTAESDDRRKDRLRRRKERERERRASYKTAERREVRLSKRRERDRTRRAARSADQRQAVLQQRRERLASETTQEREACSK